MSRRYFLLPHLYSVGRRSLGPSKLYAQAFRGEKQMLFSFDITKLKFQSHNTTNVVVVNKK